MKWKLPRDHLSPSQIGKWLRCGHQYELEYVEDFRLRPYLNMIGGSGLHAGVKHLWRAFLDLDELPTREEVEQIAVESFEDRIDKEGVELKKKEKEAGEKVAIGLVKDQMIELVDCYLEHVVPTIGVPLAVEKRIDIEIPGTGYSLVGILDLAHKSTIQGLGEVEIIEDLKWRGKAMNQGDVDRNRQLTFYAWGWSHINDRMPGAVGLRVLKPLKRGPVADPLLWSLRSTEDVKRLFRVINHVGSSITAGVFPPADSDLSWWCSPDSCGHWDHCKYCGG